LELLFEANQPRTYAITKKLHHMNPKPSAKRILCYGDSNTWGRSGKSVDRYPSNVRWTGLLQEKLGDTHEIIEEGLRARTTDFEDDDPEFPGRNGLAYLRPCLESHNPLDLVILWLGTNDLKSRFNRTPEDVGAGLKKNVELIHRVSKDFQGKSTKILLISPPLVIETHLGSGTQFAGAEAKSKELGLVYEQISKNFGCAFLDLAPIAHPGEFDGVHLEPKSHPIVADRMFEVVSKLCP
jgi:lysophospholipase L1-like esterase